MANVALWLTMTLIRPLNKGQGHSFWYQSISHNMQLPIYYRLSGNFCSGTHRLATIHNVTDDDRRTSATLQHKVISATVSTVGYKQTVTADRPDNPPLSDSDAKVKTNRRAYYWSTLANASISALNKFSRLKIRPTCLCNQHRQTTSGAKSGVWREVENIVDTLWFDRVRNVVQLKCMVYLSCLCFVYHLKNIICQLSGCVNSVLCL